MRQWQPNTGTKPQAEGKDAKPVERVFVKLRCGITPGEAWPVDTGRHQTTRWSLQGDAFDIVEWRVA